MYSGAIRALVIWSFYKPSNTLFCDGQEAFDRKNTIYSSSPDPHE